MLDICTMNFRSIAKLCLLVVSGNDSEMCGNHLADFVGQMKEVYFVFCSLAVLAFKRTNRYMGSCVLNERENISSQLKGRLVPSFSQFKAKENQLDDIPVLGIGKGLAGN